MEPSPLYRIVFTRTPTAHNQRRVRFIEADTALQALGLLAMDIEHKEGAVAFPIVRGTSEGRYDFGDFVCDSIGVCE